MNATQTDMESKDTCIESSNINIAIRTHTTGLGPTNGETLQLVYMLHKVCSQLASTEVTECTHQCLCEEVWWLPC